MCFDIIKFSNRHIFKFILSYIAVKPLHLKIVVTFDTQKVHNWIKNSYTSL